MLVLTRRPGESILIGDPEAGQVIEVQVRDVRGDQVRLGINAPRTVPVHRLEVALEIEQMQKASTQSQKASMPAGL